MFELTFSFPFRHCKPSDGNNWTFSDLPPELDFTHEFGSMKRTVEKVSENRMHIRTTLKVKAQTIDVSDIAKFNQLLDTYITQSVIRFYGEPSNAEQ